MNIVKMIFGSHLYGTDTPASDKDFKGIFLPSKEQILLGRIPKSLTANTKKSDRSKNSPDDIDTEMYSLHYFIKLACEGETVALDMLHAPPNMLLETSDIWTALVSLREKFYTKNLKAFIGYARRQASKYGIKGSRLNAAKAVLDYFGGFSPESIMAEIWDTLPLDEHCYKLKNMITGANEYQVCGKRIQETVRIKYAMSMVETFYKNYGHRAQQAAENKGIDWKAVSHALRAAYQVKQLLTENTITFPLKEAAYLRCVKSGSLDYQSIVAIELDRVMEEVEILSERSSLPAYVDKKFFDDFIIKIISEKVIR